MYNKIMTADRMRAALAPYGIQVTREIAERYQNDTLIYNLINIVVGQAEFIEELSKREYE